MKLFKTIGIAMLALSVCTGCTNNASSNVNSNSIADLEEKEYDIESTTKYEVADVEFKIPDFFNLEDADSDIKQFFADNSELPIISLQEGEGTLNDDSIEEYVNGFVGSSNGAFNNFTDFTSQLESTIDTKINYYRVYEYGNNIILKDNSKLHADLTFYFISNDKKDNFAVLMYIQYDGLKYDYEDVVYQTIQNINITDKKTDEVEITEPNSTTSSNDSSSPTTTTPSTSSNASTPSPTMGEKNALGSARQYLSISAFSYTGLINQLEYEGYSTEEATYAADNCNANWNEQAAKSAKEYLDMSSFSRQELINQLIYEGFTQEQAEYGVTRNGY